MAKNKAGRSVSNTMCFSRPYAFKISPVFKISLFDGMRQLSVSQWGWLACVMFETYLRGQYRFCLFRFNLLCFASLRISMLKCFLVALEAFACPFLRIFKCVISQACFRFALRFSRMPDGQDHRRVSSTPVSLLPLLAYSYLFKYRGDICI